jgi:hypothetical protein
MILQGSETIVVRILTSLLILLSFVIHTKYKKSIYIIFIPIVLLFIQKVTTGTFFLVVLYTVYILKHCKLKFAVYSTLLFSVVTIVAMFYLLGLGILENTGKIYNLNGGRLRYDFGWGNPNFLSMFVGSTLLLLLYYINYFNKNNLYVLSLLLVPVLYFTYLATGTKTFIVAWVLFYLTVIFKPLFINKTTIKIILLLPLLLLAFFYWAAMNYDNTFVKTIDVMLTGRIGLYNLFLTQTTNTSLLLGDVKFVRSFDKPLDSAYISLLLTGGIISFLVFYFIYLKGVNFLFLQKDYLAISMVTYYLVYGVTEMMFLSILCIPNLLFWILLSRREKYYQLHRLKTHLTYGF